MPSKIFMQIDNPQIIAARQNATHNYYLQKQQQQQQQQEQTNKTVSSRYNKGLASPMITRVHLAKPGCSSCGK